jgi:hypothetical protein
LHASIESSAPVYRRVPMLRHVIRRRLPLVAVVLTAIVAFPLGAIASHQFTDVPDSNTFHDDIEAIRDAGVTTGCGLNLYCPKDFVTREQMAAFLNRLGALEAGTNPVVNADRVDGLDATQFARTDEVVTGTYNCAGHTMIPGHSDYAFVTQQNAIWLANAGTIAVFLCPVRLPDDATVTKLRVGLRDNSGSGSLGCDLYAYPRLASGSDSQLGFVTSNLAATPGDTILEDATIFGGVIDNDTLTYNVQCTLFGPADSAELALFGASVEYETSGIPVD